MCGWLSARDGRASRSKRARTSGSADRCGGQHLDRDVAAEARVPRAIDLAHAAGAERGDDFVGTESGSGGQEHPGNLAQNGPRVALPVAEEDDATAALHATGRRPRPRLYRSRTLEPVDRDFLDELEPHEPGRGAPGVPRSRPWPATPSAGRHRGTRCSNRFGIPMRAPRQPVASNRATPSRRRANSTTAIVRSRPVQRSDTTKNVTRAKRSVHLSNAW